MQSRKFDIEGITFEILESDPAAINKLFDELTIELNRASVKKEKLDPVAAGIDFTATDKYRNDLIKTTDEYGKACDCIGSTKKAMNTALETLKAADLVNFVNHTFPLFRKEFSALHAQYKHILESKLTIPPLTDDLLKKIPVPLHEDCKKLHDLAKKMKGVVDKEFSGLQIVNKKIVEIGAKVIGNFKDAKARKEAAAAAGGAAPVQPVSQKAGDSASVPSFMHSNQDSQKKSVASNQSRPPGGPAVPNAKAQK
jgi:hypothetical protein